MRLFIAINLPPAERRAIHEAMAPMRDASRAVTWVGADQLHLTLKFLGEQPDGAAAAIADALRSAAVHGQPMRLQLSGVGAFPHLRAPRIFWLAVAAEPKLELLHHDVEVACAELGYDVDGRAFHPHVTLGRARREFSSRDSTAVAAATEQVRHTAAVDVRSVDLMSSVLTPAGPTYRVLAEIPLGGA